MMFDSRPNKYEKEQEKLRDAAKKRRENEQRLQKAQLQREKELLEIAEKRRLEKEIFEQNKLFEEENENRLTGGIKFFHVLEPYEIDGEDDKIILPESCLTDLSQQDAFGKGPVTFQIKFMNSARMTHCGVREFSAKEGSVGLPKKVLDSLVSTADELSLSSKNKVSIKFVKMSKVTFVKLQPKQNKFFDVGPVKLCLEENLRFHSTLTVGDQLTVWYRGVAHPLVVVELRPDSQGNMFDTDVEVDLELSEEYLDHQKKSSNNKSSSLSAMGHSIDSSSGSSNILASAGPALSKAVSKNEPSAVFRTLRDNANPLTDTVANTSANNVVSSSNGPQSVDYVHLLISEPQVDGVSALIRIKIRLISGATVLRRFDVKSSAAQLFYFIGNELNLQSDQLTRVQVTSKTLNRTFSLNDPQLRDGAATFEEIGLIDSNMVLMMAILP